MKLWLRRGAKSNPKQSAEQLGVQKNHLRIGFDSSTEKKAFFKPSSQKKSVAPLAVKKQGRLSHGDKNA
jgi:hypothetical protein